MSYYDNYLFVNSIAVNGTVTTLFNMTADYGHWDANENTVNIHHFLTLTTIDLCGWKS